MANLSLNSVKESYASVKESMKEIMQPYAEKVQPYARVLAARAKNRPTSQSFIAGLTEDFLEFHGDRRFGDDAAIRLASFSAKVLEPILIFSLPSVVVLTVSSYIFDNLFLY
ncbi:MAG: hypothetical protein IIV26_09650 [Peptococcaceae bacterium]|nr:hypothetical protein [Peptococcaceae bacterium]